MEKYVSAYMDDVDKPEPNAVGGDNDGVENEQQDEEAAR